MADNRLSQAILAVEGGNKAKARELLASVLQQDPKNADAWRWMAATLDDPEKKRQCWQRVLELKPNDGQALQALAESYANWEEAETGGEMPEEIQANPTGAIDDIAITTYTTEALADIATTTRYNNGLLEAQRAALEEQTKLLKRIRACAEVWLLIGSLWIIGAVLSVITFCLFGSGILATLGQLSSYG